MSRLFYALLCVVAIVLVAVGLSAFAYTKGGSSITRFGKNITVGPTDEVADLTCIACNIRVRGLVAGDITTLGGSVVLEDQAQVAGDVTSVAGDLRLDQSAKVGGDVTIVGGDMDRTSEATIGGDVTTLRGRIWVLLALAVPFVMLGIFVALMVWLIQRIRRPQIAATAS